MNGYNFTDRVRRVLELSRQQASALHHDYVGTEHILLGILQSRSGVAVATLQALDVDLDLLRTTIMQTVKPGKSAETVAELPYTSRAKKILELAMIAARELEENHVGTEHLLLGLVREERGIASQVLCHAAQMDANALSMAMLPVIKTAQGRTPSGAPAPRVFGTRDRGMPQRIPEAHVPPPWPPGARSSATTTLTLVVAVLALAVAVLALIVALRGPSS